MDAELYGREREVVEGLGRRGGVVEENLEHLAKVDSGKLWWPAKLFSFMEQGKGGYKSESRKLSELRKLRARARGLSDELLITLVGNTITEEALPNYIARLRELFSDETGVSTDPWNLWLRGWSAEEDRHGRALNQYLLLSGRVNMVAVERSIFSLINNGFEQSPSYYKGILYPMFQEPATRVSHANTATRAEEQGDEFLAKICRKIAGDEHRHAQFYFNVCRKIFDLDSEGAMIRFYELMKGEMIMPAYLMADETYPEPPTLFDHHAASVQSMGVYSLFNYADILEALNEDLNISGRSVSGEAARAQKGLIGLPPVLRKAGERERKRLKSREKVPFDWIYGKAA